MIAVENFLWRTDSLHDGVMLACVSLVFAVEQVAGYLLKAGGFFAEWLEGV